MDASKPNFRDQLRLVDELLAGLDTAQPDLNALATVAERIPSLATPIMRASNSSILGLRRRVNSLEQAFALLGSARIITITREVRVDVARRARREIRAA